MSKRESSSEIDDAAAEWATRIDAVPLGDEAQADFDSWLQGDVRRVGAFARAQAVLVHVKRAKALGSDFDPASFNQNAGAVDLIEPLANERYEPAGLTRRRMVIGASAVAATGALAIFIPNRRASARIYETGRGETRLIPLEDGSTVTLNTDSRIAVTIDHVRRAVQLVEGEALFKVASTDRAPFIVEVGDTLLRAESATFAVCQLGGRPVEVKVCDGHIKVARDSFVKGEARVLQANMQAILPPDGAMLERRVTPAALQRELAWQEGMLSFEDTPLRQAAEEFARYSNRRIRITDPLVGAETITGRYAANNPEGFARAVALSLNLSVQTMPGDIILAR